MRRLAVRLGVGLALFVATAEGAVRVGRPTPRAPVVDLAAREVAWLGGVPVWDAPGLPRASSGCAEGGAAEVVVVGDSIPSIGAEAAQTLGPRLGDRLSDALGRPVCVRVAARPGLPPQAQYALAEAVAPDAPVVVLALWRAGARWTVVGDRWWFDTTTVAVDGAGLPRSPMPLPSGLHRSLLGVSAAWRYTTLALAQEDPPGVDRAVAPHRAFLDRVRGRGAQVVVAEMPSMAVPFDAQPVSDGWVGVLRAQTEAAGGAWVEVGRVLAAQGLGVEDVRIDTCCHLNTAGHDAVAAVLVDPVRRALDAP